MAEPAIGQMMEYNDTVGYAHTNGSASPPDTSDYQCMVLTKFLLHTVMAGMVCLLGFAGNSVSFLVLMRDKATPVASFMLQALAFTDNFFLSIWLLQFSLGDMLTYFGWISRLHVSWMYIRLYTYPLLFMGQTATIWMTVLIAFSRYVAVCRPYMAASVCSVASVTKGVIGVVAGSVLYNLPRFFETDIILKTDENGTTSMAFNRTALGDSKIYKLVYFDISYYIFCFVLPLIFLAVLNVKLTISYHKVLQKKRRMSRGETHHCDPNITLVLIIIILVFMVCNTPARIVQIVWRYKTQQWLSVPFFLMEISNVLEVLNSSINFIIYCVFRQKFRCMLYDTLHCAPTPGSPEMGMETLSTYPLNGCTTTCTHHRNTELSSAFQEAGR